MTSETIDRFYAEKNVRNIKDHFDAQVEKYDLFASECDGNVRWSRARVLAKSCRFGDFCLTEG
jgi:hypothetical protein